MFHFRTEKLLIEIFNDESTRLFDELPAKHPEFGRCAAGCETTICN